MHLRGVVVPLSDLRVKFQLHGTDYDRRPVMLVLDVERRVAGLVVDGVAVSEVDRTGDGVPESSALILIDVDKFLGARHRPTEHLLSEVA